MKIRRSNNNEVAVKKAAFEAKFPQEYKEALALNIKNDFGRCKLSAEEMTTVEKVNAMMVEFGIDKANTFSIR